MSDLLVKLYTLPELEPVVERARESGVEIRRPLAPERYAVVNWVSQTSRGGRIYWRQRDDGVWEIENLDRY